MCAGDGPAALPVARHPHGQEEKRKRGQVYPAALSFIA